ncbi:hypothetical protein DPMN_083993 [Dreissena polymorpha]|uniref:Uncharacterized protein n=1 Tax=Dreissena polymorpha TaxID=45954 RepID=A0A9D3Y9Z8_DREPO|nr:hypothetical protein DPMN_083993 [Dreissena polymorpha]
MHPNAVRSVGSLFHTVAVRTGLRSVQLARPGQYTRNLPIAVYAMPRPWSDGRS